MALKEDEIVNRIIQQGPEELFKGTPDDPVIATTMAFIELLVEDLKRVLDEEDISATGRLSASISPSKVEINSSGISVEITADDYAKFVDEGVKGVENKAIDSQFEFKNLKVYPEMAQAIREWIPARGLMVRDGETYESMSYAIATGIKKKGIEP